MPNLAFARPNLIQLEKAISIEGPFPSASEHFDLGRSGFHSESERFMIQT